MKHNIKGDLMPRRLKKILLVIITVGLLFGAAFSTIGISVITSTRDRIISAEDALALEDIDCIIILGAGVRDDGSPSHMLADRLSVGVDLYMAGVSGVILVSGDHYRKNYDEVNPMRNFCIDAGVPEDDIVADHTGISTYDSICRAKEIFGAKKVIIVTQTYHMYRALYIAGKFGLDAYGVTCDLRPYRGQIYREVREFGARVKDFIYTTFKPEPVFLGDPIPLPSSSDVTES
jgi:vancomycin permeability regulator SanA